MFNLLRVIQNSDRVGDYIKVSKTLRSEIQHLVKYIEAEPQYKQLEKSDIDIAIATMKPCPFCKGLPYIVDISLLEGVTEADLLVFHPQGEAKFVGICSTCGASPSLTSPCMSIAEAIEMWNTRFLNPVDPELDVLLRTLQSLVEARDQVLIASNRVVNECKSYSSQDAVQKATRAELEALNKAKQIIHAYHDMMEVESLK